MVKGQQRHYKNTEIAIIRTSDSSCRCADAIAEGLNEIGYTSSIFNSEEILLQAGFIAENYSLVIDHTDKFLGRGSLRAYVRFILETKGARLVGAGAHASMRADDKYTTKKRFQELQIPTPEGILVDKNELEDIKHLEPPYIVKPVYEHMSRGITIEEDLERSYVLAKDLMDGLQQPVIIESFISGRELAVSMIEDVEKGLIMLPPLEWNIKSGEKYQTKYFKLVEHKGEREDVMPANLSKKELKLLSKLAKAAFRGLNMRDYCRFDIKLTPEGKFFFLEANISPSLERAEAMAISAKWAGLTYVELLEHIILSAAKRYNILIRHG